MNPDLFIHESDRQALNALKAIPGFTAVLKAFMNIWNEKQFRIINMSSNLRLGPQQLPKYYNMLLPICKKLGIPVPELYMSLDVNPNAYTYGDTQPFIVLTSGLLETMPDELIPSVLAHECGHIVCRHTLYHTMGRMLLEGSARLPGLANLISLPLQAAFFHWMRCSEYSADRAAVICDGTPNRMIQVCMRFAGFDRDIKDTASVSLFMEQAREYRDMVNGSVLNKTLELMAVHQMTHPFTAMRALECYTWASLPESRALLSGDQTVRSFANDPAYVELPCDLASLQGKHYEEVSSLLRNCGFRNVNCVPSNDHNMLTKPNTVTRVTINGTGDARKGSPQPVDAAVIVFWYSAPSTAQTILDGISSMLPGRK